MAEATYTRDQVVTAARELRQAAGTEEEDSLLPPETVENEAHIKLDTVLSMLQEEIRLLRERGFTDERIADLLCGFDIEVSGEELTRHSPPLD